MKYTSAPGSARFQRGFTLVELIMVIVLLGILAAYAIMSGGPSPGEMTLPSQSKRLASDIRYTQTLATTSGNPMRLTITAGANGSYAATCIPTGCTTTGFNRSLEQGVVLDGAPTQLDFNTRGEPTQSASYTLSLAGSTFTISVAALTGFVTVTP